MVSGDDKIWGATLVVVSWDRMKENIIRDEMKGLKGQIFVGHPHALLNSLSVAQLLVVYSTSSFYCFLINGTQGNVHWKNYLELDSAAFDSNHQ